MTPADLAARLVGSGKPITAERVGKAARHLAMAPSSAQLRNGCFDMRAEELTAWLNCLQPSARDEVLAVIDPYIRSLC